MLLTVTVLPQTQEVTIPCTQQTKGHEYEGPQGHEMKTEVVHMQKLDP